MPAYIELLPCRRAAEPRFEDRHMTWRQRWEQDGGGRELLRLALPLILSSSFLTLQITIDRALLSQASVQAVAASIPAALLYYVPMALLQFTAGYASTFVAQYVGAGRADRVGPVVWQALYFSLAAGVAFWVLVPLAVPLVALGGHSPEVQGLEVAYFRILCLAALPALIVASVNGFFSGRGATWTVLLIDGVGLTFNAVLAYGLIFGHWGLPELGIEGAGWATVCGCTTSATVALGLFLRPQFQRLYAVWSGWRPDPALFARLMRFGLPNGLQWMFDVLAFKVFLDLVGRLGDVQLAATNVAFAINTVGLLPMFGMGQAVSVLVGQRLGQDRPDLAERTTWTGWGMAMLYVGSMCLLYALAPETLFYFFRNDSAAGAARVAELVPVLLRFAAVYSLCDSMNIVFSFALRGAGDTRFVSLLVLALAWPIMVLPAWAAWYYGWGLYWCWAFASAYIMALGFAFLARFRAGKWKAMRVIEQREAAENPETRLEPVGQEVS
jgi:MATE family multidrug resistance protein